MFHFIIPLIKGRLIGLVINRVLPRLFPVIVGILRKQQDRKKENQDFSQLFPNITHTLLVKNNYKI